MSDRLWTSDDPQPEDLDAALDRRGEGPREVLAEPLRDAEQSAA